jgi:hypothetical protein
LRQRRLLALAVVAAALGSAATGSAAQHAGSTATAAPSTATAWCAGAVGWKTARASVGDVVRVKARVVSTYYARSSRGRPTFIDLGAAYPNPRRLTILIWGRNRVNFPRPPERMFRGGQLVCAQGMVSTYRGVSQIEVALWDAAGRLMSF